MSAAYRFNKAPAGSARPSYEDHDRDQEDLYRVIDHENKPLNLNYDEEDTSRQLSQHEIYILTRSLKRTNLFLKIIVALLFITILFILSLNIPQKVKDIVQTVACNLDPIIKSPVPHLRTQKVIFEKHAIYSQPPNSASNSAWDDLLPSGRGFVYVNDWDRYEMPPGQNTSFGMIYSTTLFHQLHCLGQLRRFSYLFMNAIGDQDEKKMEMVRRTFVHGGHSDHMNHCFDYLRQGIMCNGDMALEWPRTEPDGRREAVDGWDVPHECKDWTQIMDYMNEHHFDHSDVDEIAPLAGFD